jgi:hypothetical protein
VAQLTKKSELIKGGNDMAKVRFFCDSGANIHSCRKSEVLDTVDDLGLNEGEWEEMSDAGRQKEAEVWANDALEIYWEEE